jgi:hypothetical protein
VSPTVGIFIGALGTGLAALMGLNDAGFSRAKGLRIGALGLGVLAGVAGGLYVRTHELLSPSLMQQRDDYLALGYTKAQALDFLEERIRMPVETATSSAKGSAAAMAASGAAGGEGKTARVAARGGNSSVHSVLFSGTVSLSDCNLMTTKEQDEQLTAVELVSNFRQFKGWKDFAVAVEAELPEGDRKKLLLTAKRAACVDTAETAAAPQRPTAEQCRAAQDPASFSPPQLAVEFARSDVLSPVRKRVAQEISPEARGNALRLVTVFLCGVTP